MIYLALNIAESPILVFIMIVPCQFEQVLSNLCSFDQSTVSSSLRKLVKPKLEIKEKFMKLCLKAYISKPGYVLVVFVCTKQNKQYIYTYIDVIIYTPENVVLVFSRFCQCWCSGCHACRLV